MRLFHRIQSGALALILSLGLACPAAAGVSPSQITLQIFSTGGMDGRTYSQDPLTEEAVPVSYLKAAAALSEERSAADESILLDLGNAVSSGALSGYAAGQSSEGYDPAAVCLRYLDYDALIPGRRELSLNREPGQALWEFLSEDSARAAGSPVDVLCANYLDAAAQEPVFKPYKILSYTVGGKVFRVGILGFGNADLPASAPVIRYEGAALSSSENDAGSYVYEWTHRWQKELREDEGCDFVIAALHSGLGSSDVFDPSSQAAWLASHTEGIDLILASGESAGVTAFRNTAGKQVSVVCPGGSTLTKTSLTIRRDGTFSLGKSQCLDLAGCEDDPGLSVLMALYYDREDSLLDSDLGSLSGQWDDVTSLSLIQNDTMNLVHEAQLWASGAQVSIAVPAAAEGFSVSSLLDSRGHGTVTLRDCWSIYGRDGDTLYLIEMTGEQIRKWLEACATQYSVDSSGYIVGSSQIAQVYGISYNVYLGNPEGVRVASLIYDGKPVNEGQIFRVAVSSQLLSTTAQNDPYGWYAVTGINLESNQILWDASVSDDFSSDGGSVTLILSEYIRAMTARGRELTPPTAKSRWTMVGSTSQEAMASVTRLELAEALYEEAGRPAVTAGGFTFSDMPQNSSAAVWAAQSGIILGSGGLFQPDVPVTREQALLMFLRFDRYRGQGPSGDWAAALPYTDAADGSPWAAEALMWNVVRQYLLPDAAGNLRPQASLNAAEMNAALRIIRKFGAEQ